MINPNMMSREDMEANVRHLERELDLIAKDDLTALGQTYIALCRAREQLIDY